MFKKKAYILFLMVLLRMQFCYSANNTVTIPDANFRSFLMANYPGVMAGSLLDTLKAGNVLGTINCRAKAISNIYGIQYFKKISELNLNNNLITVLPVFRDFNNLQKLSCDTNQLTSLPELKTMPLLTGLSCKKNNLTSLPTLSALTNLQYLCCSLNNLPSLPSLTGLTKLTTLDCAENKLVKLPTLSSLVMLENLYCSANLLNTLPSLDNLTKLQLLYCGDNLLTELPNLSYNTLLNRLRISNNKIGALPTLPFTTAPLAVYLDYNNLSFEDLLPVVNSSVYISNPAPYKLFPQNQIGNSSDTLMKRKGSFSINLQVDAGVVNNTYRWYKNGMLFYIGNSNLFSIPDVDITNSGNYYVMVKNSHPAFAGDSIVSAVHFLNVVDCFSGRNLSYTYSSISCKDGFLMTIDLGSGSGGTAPFTYEIVNVSTGEKIISKDKTISGIKEGDYTLVMKDSASCETPSVFCKLVSGSDCDPVFSPNGDGLADTYFISTSGKARIYDKTGQLIQELNTPVYWDGLDKNGREVPSGYYVIIVDEKTTTNVSLMR